MQTFITVVHITTCIFLVLVVLIQSGKGAEISASFGGSSQTVFGSSGAANFFTKLTAWLATIFFITSLTLTILGSRVKKSVFEGMTPVTDTSVPKDSTSSAPTTGDAGTNPANTAPSSAQDAAKTEGKKSEETQAQPGQAEAPKADAPAQANP